MASTYINIVSSSASYTLPGTSWTVESVQRTFAETVPGINNMTAETSTDENGDVTMTFRMRTGTKG